MRCTSCYTETLHSPGHTLQLSPPLDYMLRNSSHPKLSEQALMWADEQITSEANQQRSELTWPRPCFRMAFLKMVSLSPVSMRWSTSCGVGFRPVTIWARRSTTCLHHTALLATAHHMLAQKVHAADAPTEESAQLHTGSCTQHRAVWVI